MQDDFSARLAVAIARSGKPKGDLASHCGVALSTVSRWLKGARPKPETSAQIAEFLGVDILWLLGKPNEPKEALDHMGAMLSAVGNEMRSEAKISVEERHKRRLAMETTAEFAERIKTTAETVHAFLQQLGDLCKAINTSPRDQPIAADLKAVAADIRIRLPQLDGRLVHLFADSVILRTLAESSPEMMKILRS